MTRQTIAPAAIPCETFCHRCQTNTPTAIIPLAGGHLGNCCARCRTCRRGRPYVGRRDAENFNRNPMPDRADGNCHATAAKV